MGVHSTETSELALDKGEHSALAVLFKTPLSRLLQREVAFLASISSMVFLIRLPGFGYFFDTSQTRSENQFNLYSQCLPRSHSAF